MVIPADDMISCREIRAGTQGRKLEAGTDVEAMRNAAYFKKKYRGNKDITDRMCKTVRVFCKQ